MHKASERVNSVTIMKTDIFGDKKGDMIQTDYWPGNGTVILLGESWLHNVKLLQLATSANCTVLRYLNISIYSIYWTFCSTTLI